MGAIEFWESESEDHTLFSTASHGGTARIWRLPTSGNWQEYGELFLENPLEDRKKSITDDLHQPGTPRQRSEKIRQRVNAVLAQWGRGG